LQNYNIILGILIRYYHTSLGWHSHREKAFVYKFKLIYLRSIAKQVIPTYINHSRPLIPDGIHLIFWTRFERFVYRLAFNKIWYKQSAEQVSNSIGLIPTTFGFTWVSDKLIGKPNFPYALIHILTGYWSYFKWFYCFRNFIFWGQCNCSSTINISHFVSLYFVNKQIHVCAAYLEL